MNQTYKQSNQAIELVNRSGVDTIDSLLNNRWGQPMRWVSDPIYSNSDSDNSSTVITYSFPGLNKNFAYFNYQDDIGDISSIPFSKKQVSDTRKALNNISEYIGEVENEFCPTIQQLQLINLGQLSL